MSCFTYNTTDTENKSSIIVPIKLEELPPPTENWDNDTAGTYDATEHSAKKIVLRCLFRASKREKKRFRKMERSRILKLLECELPFINHLRDITLKDDICEQISHICKLTISDRLTADEAMVREFIRMKISQTWKS